MASATQSLTTYYAKRIIGDTAAADETSALLQTGAGVATDTWILHRTNRNKLYGIKYLYDNSSGGQADKIELYGDDTPTVWAELDTGDVYIMGKVGIGYDPNTTGNSYKLYVNGSSYIKGSLSTGSALKVRAQDNVHEGGEIILSPATSSFSTVHIDAYDSMFRLHDGTNERFKVNLSNGNTTINGKLGIGSDQAVLDGNYKLYVNGTSYFNDLIYQVSNGNTITIGSQNTTASHIYSSTNIPFAFNNTILTTTGNLGSTSYPWGNLYIGTADGAGIYYVTSNYTKEVIRFLNHSTDQYGVGLKICTGGLIIIGAGESGDTVQTNLTPASSAETLYLASDGNIEFYPTQDTYNEGYKISMYNNRLWVGVDGNTSSEGQIGVRSGSGSMYMWSHSSATGDRGIYVLAHGSGAAHAIFTVNTNNQTAFADYYNNTMTKLAYSQAGLAASAITWLTCWNGYELRAISKAEMANATDSAHKWVRLAGDTMTGNLTLPAGGRLGKASGNLYIGASDNSGWVLSQDICSHSGTGDTYWSLRVAGTAHFKTAYGAVWNDYAEMRNVPKAQINIHRIYDEKGEVDRDYPYAGYCVYEIGNGEMEITDQRLMKGCKIISDTFGFCIGETENCCTPIAVTGRVLAYPYENIEEFKEHIGDCVCSGPNGTISLMTQEEKIKHPECIVGTISEIPNYDVWHCGNKLTKPIDVNGRIWIYVK